MLCSSQCTRQFSTKRHLDTILYTEHERKSCCTVWQDGVKYEQTKVTSLKTDALKWTWWSGSIQCKRTSFLASFASSAGKASKKQISTCTKECDLKTFRAGRNLFAKEARIEVLLKLTFLVCVTTLFIFSLLESFFPWNRRLSSSSPEFWGGYRHWSCHTQTSVLSSHLPLTVNVKIVQIVPHRISGNWIWLTR